MMDWRPAQSAQCASGTATRQANVAITTQGSDKDKGKEAKEEEKPTAKERREHIAKVSQAATSGEKALEIQ